MQQPPDPYAPHWSPDGRFWWDGVRWVPVSVQTWMPPPPGQSFNWEPSPGLRPFLIVMLVIGDILSGLLALAGALALLQYLGFLGGSTTPGDTGGFALIAFFLVLFALTLGATIGVVRRTRWARVLALVDGALFCLTCLGVVIGIPVLIAAARAPMKRRPAAGGSG